RASENTVNGTAKRSASRTTGAWLADAAATSATICWYWLSAATAVARSSTASTPLTEPESSASPATFSTGMLSPVSEDSSTVVAGETSTPSTGTTSEGRTSTSSPTATSSTGT